MPSLEVLGTGALAAVTVVLAVVSTRAILAATNGEPAVPLDDTYIHFQFARGIATLTPLVYSPGDPAVAGATSLLWPALLAPFWALGLRGSLLVWPAWLFGWLALFGLALETWRLGRGLLSGGVAYGAGLGVLCFGGLVWCAGSGMEVVPFAWLLVRTARAAAEHYDRRQSSATARELWLLLTLGLLCPLGRPEGVLGSLMVMLTLSLAPRGRPRALSLIPLAGPVLLPLIQWSLTGDAASTTSIVKWLPVNPYQAGGRVLQSIGHNLHVLVHTLLDGRVWSAVFIPSGGKLVAWLAPIALVALAYRRRQVHRGALVLLIAVGILLPTTYDSFLWNRLRYLWPFAPGWLIALGALADALGEALGRLRPELRPARLLACGGVLGALASHWSWTIDDLATSAGGIHAQQVSLGRWAKQELPTAARIGVNDTGAIAYFSERRTFDVVGLTTASEARYWVAGTGSRFEHYERLPESALPSHFIVYPAWMGAPVLLGEHLTERTVTGATILGGTTMAAHRARWDALRSAELPAESRPGAHLLDSLDVADLESEAAHDYQLLDARQTDNQLFGDPWTKPLRADGGRARRAREQFRLDLTPSGELVLRVSCEARVTLALRAGEHELGRVTCEPVHPWTEPRLRLPPTLPRGPQSVAVTAEGGTFAALHYWVFDGAP